MKNNAPFDLQDFLPYLLNQAAESSSSGFRSIYRNRYGMLRTEWRVLFHLGTYGEMTARDICERASLHKTKVSRAVFALEQRRLVKRERSKTDRRFEIISLTSQGKTAYTDLKKQAQTYNDGLTAKLTKQEHTALLSALNKLWVR